MGLNSWYKVVEERIRALGYNPIENYPVWGTERKNKEEKCTKAQNLWMIIKHTKISRMDAQKEKRDKKSR